MFLPIRGRLTNTYCFGPTDGPNPSLLAHGGFAGSSELWLQPFELLSRHGRVITYDHRGSGENPATEDEISIDEMVDDLLAVADALELNQPVVAGESMGAAVVLKAAIENPHRFGGLIIVDGSPTWDRERSEAFAAALRSTYRAAIEGFIERCLPEPDSDHIKRWGIDILTRSTPEASARLVESVWGTNLVPHLAGIDLPTLVIHGDADAVVPLTAGKLIAETIPNARLAVIEGCGHVPTLTFPERTANEIDQFLKEIACAAATKQGV